MSKKRSKKKSIKSKPKLSEEDVISLKLMKKGQKLEDTFIRKIKKFLHLHMDNYASKYGIRIEGTLFFINFLAIVLFIIDTYDLTGTAKSILVTAEIILISIFIVEYATRMWIAERKIKHFFNIYSLIDLVAILPILGILPIVSYFPNLTFFRVFRILRLFRMLRVLRFQRIFKSKETMFGKFSDSKLIITRIVLTIFTIILVSSGLIWTVENYYNPGLFSNIWETMYFVIVTIATVGYGDITPVSWAGKALTTLMILSGIALIPWQLGKLIKVLVLEATKTKVECKKCGLEEHDPDSKYCRICGTKLEKKKLEKEKKKDSEREPPEEEQKAT